MAKLLPKGYLKQDKGDLDKAISRFEFVSCVMPGMNEICDIR